MAHTIGTIGARTVAATSPVTASVTVLAGETVLVVMLVATGATDRAGGALTYGSQTLIQANSTQKAATTPEVSAELWYVVNPTVGTDTLTIPNTGSISIRYHAVAARAPAGGASVFSADSGANGTSANPTSSVALAEAGNIIFAVVGSGHTTWAPTAQTGTIISNTDVGANGDGFQYLILNTTGTQAMSWTQASDDWGTVAAAFAERPAVGFNNYLHVDAESGVSVTEKIR